MSIGPAGLAGDREDHEHADGERDRRDERPDGWLEPAASSDAVVRVGVRGGAGHRCATVPHRRGSSRRQRPGGGAQARDLLGRGRLPARTGIGVQHRARRGDESPARPRRERRARARQDSPPCAPIPGSRNGARGISSRALRDDVALRRADDGADRRQRSVDVARRAGRRARRPAPTAGRRPRARAPAGRRCPGSRCARARRARARAHGSPRRRARARRRRGTG